MADYSRPSKSHGTAMYPVHVNGSSNLLRRVEPLITPEKLKTRHLKGVLEMAKRFGVNYTNEELKDQINLAVNQAELELDVLLFGEQIKEKHPMDLALYRQYNHLRTHNSPIVSIEKLSITSSNGVNLFVIPAEWIEMSNANQGQINVIPILGLYGQTSPGADASVVSGGVFLTVVRGLDWVPAYWEIEYTTGVCRDVGHVPVTINQLIGVMAAMEILSNIAPNNMNNSVSLSQDGIGQSSSNPGVQIFQTRMAELQQKKKTLIGQLKRVFGRKYFITNI
jgi:hypothetical protein